MGAFLCFYNGFLRASCGQDFSNPPWLSKRTDNCSDIITLQMEKLVSRQSSYHGGSSRREVWLGRVLPQPHGGRQMCVERRGCIFANDL
ncbi:hypothetical protein QL285_051673 [Trifolium repens]|nr:hypothetical protein QL285_051673 [Trifolium repens]